MIVQHFSLSRMRIYEQLIIYQNPTSNKLYIQPESKCKRELYISVAQLIISTDKNYIDVSKFSKGTYYLKFGTAVRKVVIQ